MYNATLEVTWHESKRKANLKKHGLDFADAHKVFTGPMAVIEDDREDYGEQRMVGIGFLDCQVVLVVHIENNGVIHVISMRKAGNDETDLFFEMYGI